MIYGRTSAALASRFLREIPESCIQRRGGFRRAESAPVPAYNAYTPQPPKRKEELYHTKTASSATYLELNKGDMVMHAAFGRGLVLSVIKMGGDALLEIAFDDIGTKKLMAKTASAHMKKL